MKSKVKKRFLCFIIALVYAFVPTLANAVSENNLTKYAENNILYYDPDEEECTTEDASILMIGDSLTFLAQDYLSEYNPDALPGRPWKYRLSSGTLKTGDNYAKTADQSGLEVLKSKWSSNYNVLVWLLGTNNRSATNDFYADLEQSDVEDLEAIVGEDTTVLLMNYYDKTKPSIYDKNNKIVNALDNSHDGKWHVLDWASIADQYVYDDTTDGFSVHMKDDTGFQAFANMVKEGIKKYAGEGVTTCKKTCSSGTVNSNDINIITGDNTNTVLNALIKAGYSKSSTAAIAGSLEAESEFNPRALELEYNGSRIAPDDFIAFDVTKDDVSGKTYKGGFGLAQWTSWNRVRNLQMFANKENKKVIDIRAQIGYLIQELAEYSLSPSILNSYSLEEASRKVLIDYEAPYNQSQSVIDYRYSIAQKYYNQLNGSSEVSPDTSETVGQNNIPKPSNTCIPEYADPIGDTTSINEDLSDFNITVYLQCDSRWAESLFGSKTICKAGCGPTSFATISQALTGVVRTPDITASDAKDYYDPGNGAKHEITSFLSSKYGLTATNISAKSDESITNNINNALKSGAMIHTSGNGNIPFSPGGHYIAIVGITKNGNWVVANSSKNKGILRVYNPTTLIDAGINRNNIWAVTR